MIQLELEVRRMFGGRALSRRKGAKDIPAKHGHGQPTPARRGAKRFGRPKDREAMWPNRIAAADLVRNRDSVLCDRLRSGGRRGQPV